MTERQNHIRTFIDKLKDPNWTPSMHEINLFLYAVRAEFAYRAEVRNRVNGIFQSNVPRTETVELCWYLRDNRLI